MTFLVLAAVAFAGYVALMVKLDRRRAREEQEAFSAFAKAMYEMGKISGERAARAAPATAPTRTAEPADD